MLISTKALYLSSKTKIVPNFLTVRPISILNVDLNSSKNEEKKKGRKDGRTDSLAKVRLGYIRLNKLTLC